MAKWTHECGFVWAESCSSEGPDQPNTCHLSSLCSSLQLGWSADFVKELGGEGCLSQSENLSFIFSFLALERGQGMDKINEVFLMRQLIKNHTWGLATLHNIVLLLFGI